MRKTNKARPLWVIKAGSQMVIEGGPRLIRSWMRQTKILKRKYSIDVIWVTSGAIATARIQTGRHLKRSGSRKSQNSARALAEKQALSALGQPMVMQSYNRALASQKLFGSQVLLTADDLAHSSRRKNLVRTLTTLLSWGVLPILNENDAVSTIEIQFGDNDQLSALVATHMQADRLMLLTDVDGLYDADPKKYPQALHLREVSKVRSQLVRSLHSSSVSQNGTGGMLSKVLAARTANRRGIPTHLVRGSLPNAILKLASALEEGGQTPGTLIGKR